MREPSEFWSSRLWLWTKISTTLRSLLSLLFRLCGRNGYAANRNLRKGNPFVRVLFPSDPWTASSTAPHAERFKGFLGRYGNISVAMESRCDALTVLAVYHGARREVGLEGPAYYRFFDREVHNVGGALEDTPAIPPWPDEYNHAHHDIVSGQKEVADYMAQVYECDKGRVQWEEELQVLKEIAALLTREDVDKKFKKGAEYRFRRMFRDKGHERELWKNVAKIHSVLLEDQATKKELCKLYNDKSTRREWKVLLDEIGIPEDDRDKYH